MVKPARVCGQLCREGKTCLPDVVYEGGAEFGEKDEW